MKSNHSIPLQICTTSWFSKQSRFMCPFNRQTNWPRLAEEV